MFFITLASVFAGMTDVLRGLLARRFESARTRETVVAGVACALILAAQLPTESELARRFGVAIYTVRAGIGALVHAGILTRNVEEPKIPLKPALGTAATSDGKSTTTFGFAGAF